MNDKQRTEGRNFKLPEEASSNEEPEARQAKTFIPDQNELLNTVPEAITSGERLPHVSEYSGITLKAIPLKGLKSFLHGFYLFIFVLVGWEVFSVLKSALETHWIIASSFAFLLVVVGGLGLRVLRNYLYDQENQEELEEIRKQACRLREIHDVGNAKNFVQTLKGFYTNKPQIVYFQKCIEQLPDYSNDREVIDHIDRVFLQPLDKEALRRISKFSLQTGTAVAVSPWASMDMLFSLWRSIKMLDDVAQVYGMRPSLVNRYSMLKLVMHQLAFVGASEVMIEQAMEEFGSSTLTGIAGARLGQGLGAGIYTAKIGIAAMKVSRPIEFSKENQPKSKSIIVPLVENIRAIILKGADRC